MTRHNSLIMYACINACTCINFAFRSKIKLYVTKQFYVTDVYGENRFIKALPFCVYHTTHN